MALVSEPDWAYLPVPILCSILDKLPEPIDHLWFGAVCKQWRPHLDQNEDYRLQLTDHFKVYKLRLDEQSGKVMERIELKSLGDDTLFVGDNYSMAVSAANFPGCQPNSIYFTHDYIDVTGFNESYTPHDLGVFNMVDGTSGQHYILKPLDKQMPPVLWIVPPFQRK
uniref:KIB1-4 beta-propeller domain-containing protein n=1 Tax=Fagus sylvatica TaxID=28930 RepID=A0A2N9FAR1_FAGSY